MAHDSPERPKRTKRFQQINDAYYTLSDATRRRDYDEARKWHTGSTSGGFEEEEADEEIPRQKPWWSQYFPGGSASKQAEGFANTQFGDAFEEMMRDAEMSEEEEVDGKKTEVPTKRFWSIAGAISGGTLGFIAANAVGAVTGAVAGYKFGGIRDQKGKSVYEVFQGLPPESRAKLLSELAAKIFQGAIS